jgi:hypothetical protein
MKRLLVLATLMMISTLVFGQASGNNTIANQCPSLASGAVCTVTNTSGAGTVSFEYKFVGSPVTVSVVVQGCMTGGTCDTLNTYTGTTDTIVRIDLSGKGPYPRFTITPTFTGGSNPRVSVNAYGTIAGSGAGGTVLLPGAVNDVPCILGTSSLGPCASGSLTYNGGTFTTPFLYVGGIATAHGLSLLPGYPQDTTAVPGKLLKQVAGNYLLPAVTDTAVPLALATGVPDPAHVQVAASGLQAACLFDPGGATDKQYALESTVGGHPGECMKSGGTTVPIASCWLGTIAGDSGAGVNGNVVVNPGCPPPGGSGSPGGTTGQAQYNAGSGNFGGFTVGGDGTLNTSTGALAVTKTGGVSFAPSATTDTTSATNISGGTLSPSRMGSFGANQILGGPTTPHANAAAPTIRGAVPGDILLGVNYLWLKDDFCGTSVATGSIGELGWAITGGGTFAGVPSVANHPCLVKYPTTTSSGNVATLFLASGGSQNNGVVLTPGSQTWYHRIIVTQDSGNVNPTTQLKYRCGWINNVTSDSPNGWYFENVTAGSAGNWVYKVVGGAGGPDTLTAGSPVVMDTSFHNIEIYNDGANNISMWIDGTLYLSGAITHPYTAAVTSFSCQTVTTEAQAKAFDLDYFSAWIGVTR